MFLLNVFNSVKEINRLRKKYKGLLIKVLSNVYLKSYYWEKMTFSKLRFSKFKRFATSSVFWELQLMYISLNFKTSEIWEQNNVWIFHYYNFERNYKLLKWKNPCILLNKNINFNKGETEWKMENSIYSFKDKNLVLQLISKS